MPDDKNSSNNIPRGSDPRSFSNRVRRALRGEVDARTVTLEVVRRSRASFRQRRERAELEQLGLKPARLHSRYAKLYPDHLLSHFRDRTEPKFFRGFVRSFDPAVPGFKIQIAAETPTVTKPNEWLRDPVSGIVWPLDYHLDLKLQRGDGSDVRVLWELNRLGHLVELGCAYTATRDEKHCREFFAQIEDWRKSNPLGRGPNWACAMEVALRVMNLLAAFAAFRHSPEMDAVRLQAMLALFEQHGDFIRRNSEFSYIATSNHYLSDVVGLLWLGIMLPELRAAQAWRKFGLREMLREMEVQILPDGADFESSTGYHRLVLELFMYSFILCRENGIEIEPRYWDKLRGMVAYLRAYIRPDGRAPLIGDTDGGQVMPVVKRDGDDHAYLAAVGAALFEDPTLKINDDSAPPEVLWFLGRRGVEAYEKLAATTIASQAFPDAGTYILRDADLYLLLNTSSAGVNGRGSHGHNDALSIEVSAGGAAFLVDPGTYLYSADWDERGRFRSTAYHSTVCVDKTEQNTTDRNMPFIIGDEASPRVISYEFMPERDVVIAEHAGYGRLPEPVVHRREVTFDKTERYWLVIDTLAGSGRHQFDFYFHFGPDLRIEIENTSLIRAVDESTGTQLLIVALDAMNAPTLETQFSSRDYGTKFSSVAARWTATTDAPFTQRFAILPVLANEDETARRSLLDGLRTDTPTP